MAMIEINKRETETHTLLDALLGFTNQLTDILDRLGAEGVDDLEAEVGTEVLTLGELRERIERHLGHNRP
jgi:hypothetical protein